LLTDAIIAVGPEFVARFTHYIETANAMHARKAIKKQMQAAYRAYDLAFYAATMRLPFSAPSAPHGQVAKRRVAFTPNPQGRVAPFLPSHSHTKRNAPM
jgi:hypothetical protein